MGCDVHGFTEIQICGKWHAYSKWDCGRSYALFAALAGVRSDDEPPHAVCEPKGLPADISVIAGAEARSWYGDAHSHSWLTLEEMREAVKRYRDYSELQGYKPDSDYGWMSWAEKQFGGYLRGNSIIPDENEGGDCWSMKVLNATGIRYVFWFDN